MTVFTRPRTLPAWAVRVGDQVAYTGVLDPDPVNHVDLAARPDVYWLPVDRRHLLEDDRVAFQHDVDVFVEFHAGDNVVIRERAEEAS